MGAMAAARPARIASRRGLRAGRSAALGDGRRGGRLGAPPVGSAERVRGFGAFAELAAARATRASGGPDGAESSAGRRAVPDILLLAGTAEARALAGRLAARGVDAVASLAGATRAPADYGVAVRSGGFGGAEGLAAWLRAERVRALVDATHPFAARMPWNAVAACAAAGVPRLRLLRPAWPVRPGWRVVGSLDEAAAALPAGARVLLTTGREVAPFAGRTDCRFWLRSIEPVAVPAHVTPLLARPPFRVDEEAAMIRRLRATHLVSKNAGGGAAKLDAAAALGIEVVMVARPAPPPGPLAATVERALDWVVATAGSRPRA